VKPHINEWRWPWKWYWKRWVLGSFARQTQQQDNITDTSERKLARWCCQTNGPKHQYSFDEYVYEITKERHSVRAASRYSLNVLRFESDLCELNRLWNEAWIGANFCNPCTRLSLCIVGCYGLHNLCITLKTTLGCFSKIGAWNERDTYLHGYAPPHRSLYPIVQIYLATNDNIAIWLI